MNCDVCRKDIARNDVVTELIVHTSQGPLLVSFCFGCLERMYLGAIKLRCTKEEAH